MEGLVLGRIEALEFLPGLLQRLDSRPLKLGHLDEDGGVIPERLEKGLVLTGERAVLLVEELNHPIVSPARLWRGTHRTLRVR